LLPSQTPHAANHVALPSLSATSHRPPRLPITVVLRVEMRLRRSVMKNWLPPVSGPVEGHATVPRK
jgi:hypothetical protein